VVADLAAAVAALVAAAHRGDGEMNLTLMAVKATHR